MKPPKPTSNGTFTALLLFCIALALLIGSFYGYNKGVQDTNAIYQHGSSDTTINSLDSLETYYDKEGNGHIKP